MLLNDLNKSLPFLPGSKKERERIRHCAMRCDPGGGFLFRDVGVDIWMLRIGPRYRRSCRGRQRQKRTVKQKNDMYSQHPRISECLQKLLYSLSYFVKIIFIGPISNVTKASLMYSSLHCRETRLSHRFHPKLYNQNDRRTGPHICLQELLRLCLHVGQNMCRK